MCLVSYGMGVIRFPVERSKDSLWVSGPLSTHSIAPFDVRIANDGGVLSFDLSLNWSPWIVEGGAGRPDVNAAVARLADLGWDVTTGDLP